jgi:hypothetical protein
MHKKEAVIYLHPKVLFCRPFNHTFSYEHNNRTLNINTQHKYSKRSEVSKKRDAEKIGGKFTSYWTFGKYGMTVYTHFGSL